VSIEVHRAVIRKAQQWQSAFPQIRHVEWAFGVLKNHSTGSRYGVNGVTHHLRAHVWKLFAQLTVLEVMQCHPIPYFGLLHRGGQGIADAGKRGLQLNQARMLLDVGVQWNPQS
jgi:hypothetical protein